MDASLHPVTALPEDDPYLKLDDSVRAVLAPRVALAS